LTGQGFCLKSQRFGSLKVVIMHHLFFSPHPDDVVLSCGGLIYQLTQAGETVSVFTVMSGPIPPDAADQPFVQELVARWKLGPEPVSGRKAEDQDAVRFLGGTVRFGTLPDAPYRSDAQGHPLYHDREALFGGFNPQDPALLRLDEITQPCDPAAVHYFPLGVGNHVDHVMVRNALRDWGVSHPEVAVFFYEEYPYSATGDEVVQAARANLDQPTEPVIHRLNEAAITAKIRAIACYPSQVGSFWADGSVMAEAIKRHATQVGQGSYAERLWKPLSF
jgi:LmbE family N-acetylglucosaminyl deacetylase